MTVITIITYRKIPKISLGAYSYQRPFLRGLFLEGLIYRGKFALENRLGLPCWKEIYRFCFVLLCIRGQFPSTSPGGAYFRRGDLTEGFCVKSLGGLYLEGLIFGMLRHFAWNSFFSRDTFGRLKI